MHGLAILIIYNQQDQIVASCTTDYYDQFGLSSADDEHAAYPATQL